MNSISTHDVADAAGVSYRRVDYWDRTGVLHSVRGRSGSGNHRRWTHHECVVAGAVGVLADLGATNPALTPAAEHLRHTPLDRWVGPVHVTPSGVVVEQLELAGPAAWTIDLGVIARQVLDRLHSLVAA